ncbi:histidine kinase [Flavobacteriaceae bacterium S356]|uniref:Histidine kinase n=1 Tax=Asprobacillus argus TaxID=3076534 RepID=A0ABU3LG75_9FLAO|nr:histidine kinase [Flavobacteriaceae bacterium S356]
MNSKLNKSDILLLAAFFGVSVSLEIYDYYINKYVLLEYLIDIPAEVILSLALIYFFTFWLIPKYIVQKKKYFHFIIYGVLSLLITGAIKYTSGFWTGNNDWSKFPKGFNLFLTYLNVGSELVAFPLGVLLTKKFYEGQVLLSKTKEQQKENELKLLRSQLDPHFLFNNLNTLDSLIDRDSAKAKEYINRLSLIYRYLIQTKDSEVMELSEELNFAENYIFLIKTRFENDYDFEIIKNTSVDGKFIPTGAIQALLENVVKHNKPQNNTTINASIRINEKRLTVSNTRSEIISTEESFGTGLENLKIRYQLLSDKEIEVESSEATFTISIPIIKLISDN